MKQIQRWILGLSLAAMAGTALAQSGTRPGESREAGTLITLNGRVLKFSRDAQPFLEGRTTLVSVPDMARHLDVSVAESEGFVRLRYRGDEAVYRRYAEDYELNGRTRRLPRRGEERNGRLYLPMDLFRDLTNSPLLSRYDGFGQGRFPDRRPDRRSDRSVYFRGRELRYDRNAEPFSASGTVYVPMFSTARQAEVRVESNVGSNRNRYRLRNGNDEIVLEVRRDEAEVRDRWVRLPGPVTERSGEVFVPAIVFHTLVGRDLEVEGAPYRGRLYDRDYDDGRPGNRDDFEIFYRGRELRLRGADEPIVEGGEIFVPARAFANAIDVDYDRGRDDRSFRLRRDRVEIRYDYPDRFYELNGRRREMRRGGIESRDRIFVPLSLFDVFTDGRVEVRRRR
jgi:hypothetical protein